jgi:hypothetical protein
MQELIQNILIMEVLLKDNLRLHQQEIQVSCKEKCSNGNNKSFTNLYFFGNKIDGEMGKHRFDKKSINSKFHESTWCLHETRKQMYFTRNNYLDGKKQKKFGKNNFTKII